MHTREENLVKSRSTQWKLRRVQVGFGLIKD